MQRKHLKRTDFCETPLTHRGAGRLRAQLRGVTVERCSERGILAYDGGSVELTEGSVADCEYGVECGGSGKATVRTARPRTAETPRSTPRSLAAFFARLPFVLPPVLWLAGTAAKRRLIQDQKRR